MEEITGDEDIGDLYAILEREQLLAQVRIMQKARVAGEAPSAAQQNAVNARLKAADVGTARGGAGETDDGFEKLAGGLSKPMQAKLAKILAMGNITPEQALEVLGVAGEDSDES